MEVSSGQTNQFLAKRQGHEWGEVEGLEVKGGGGEGWRVGLKLETTRLAGPH